ncbi:MAG: GspE/PulE family protein [Campylobacterales bacterium]|nr:GspE/PulE family protein [Campylobacterales bacterium]
MIDFPKLEDVNLSPLELEDVDLPLAIKYYVLFSEVDGTTTICISENHLADALGFIAKHTFDYPIVFLDEDSFERLYNKFLELRTDNALGDITNQEEIDEIAVDEDEFSLSDFLRNDSDLLSSEESAPIIKFVNSLFYQAIKRKASDIHIEVHEFKGEIRFRIDGALVKYVDLDRKVMSFVISRIKVISNMDISEKRITQDGRTQVKIAGKVLDIRVSSLPTFYGERIVMRILMESEDIPHMEDLGFEPELIAEFDELLKHSHGIILVTGPTGSGKSTTLHAFLQQVATPEKNIITVEDPVEYKSDNISQVQVNDKVGLTFASGLRSILRQDPDVIMLGEIRDGETATISIQASLTGHLVFSTLHTNNATAAITRMVDMGVERFLISSAILGVLAQRLVRKLCNSCKCEDEVANVYKEEFAIKDDAIIYRSEGCKECNYTGYSGRVAIGELFKMEDNVVELLKDEVDDHEIRTLSIQNGMKTLSSQLVTLVERGVTSMDEAIRVGIKER